MVIFNTMELGYIVGWQSDLVNTKESIIPVCDKPYHTNKIILQKWEAIEKLRNYALKNIGTDCIVTLLFNTLLLTNENK